MIKQLLFPSPKEPLVVFVRHAAKLMMLWLLFISHSFAPATYATCSCDSPLVTLQPTRYPLPSDGNGSQSIAVGDFNNDGKNDLLIANRNSHNVSVMFGNGSGGFSPASSSIGVGEIPLAIVAKDFNGDGNLDFATANQVGSRTTGVGLSIRYGNGNGGAFGVDLPILVDPNNPNSDRMHGSDLSAIDFDHSTSSDLAIATQSFDGAFTRIALFRNVGGSFTQIDNVNVTSPDLGPNSISVADFSNDGWDDMVVVRPGIFNTSNNLFLLINNHLGGWTITGLDAGQVSLQTSAVADYDRDGDVDLLVGANNFIDNSAFLALYLNNGSGTLTVSATSGFSNLARLTAADINMDGFGDFIATRYFNGVTAILGNRSAALGSMTFSITSGQSPNETGVGDFNGDGKPDMALPSTNSNEVSILLNTNNLNAIRKTDYNGDGRTDFAIWRPTDGNWWVRYSYFGTGMVTPFGSNGDVPVPGDYDGDGKTDLSVYRPGTNTWYVLRSSNNTFYSVPYGLGGDKLVPGDYDGDCKTDIAVWRPSNHTWYILRSSDSGYTYAYFGQSGDIPVPGDYDGDCKTDVAVFRPSSGTWHVLQSSTGGYTVQNWGLSGDKPVQGDYDGDGKTDIAIWRPGNRKQPGDREWWILQSTDGVIVRQLGANGDVPQPGDYDGDGHADLSVWRPGDGKWYIERSSDGQVIVQPWGVGSDLAASAPYPIE